MDVNLIECFLVSSNVCLDPRLVYEIFLILSIQGVVILALTSVIYSHGDCQVLIVPCVGLHPSIFLLLQRWSLTRHLALHVRSSPLRRRVLSRHLHSALSLEVKSYPHLLSRVDDRQGHGSRGTGDDQREQQRKQKVEMMGNR